MGANPKVTVITPVYNSGKYLRDAIESVLAQTFSDFEYIIVYDKSEDDTLDIIKDYCKKDTRIKLLVNEERKGLSYAWERGFLESKGEWIVYVDSDDIMSCKMIEASLLVADKYNSDYVFFDIYTFSDNNFVDIFDNKYYQEPYDLSPRDFLYDALTFKLKGGMGTSGKIAKRELYTRIDYSEMKKKYPRAFFDDCYLPIRLVDAAGKVTHCPMKLMAQRSHSDSTSRTIAANEHLAQYIFAGEENIKFFEKYQFPQKLIRTWYECLLKGGIKVYYSGYKENKIEYMNRAKDFFDRLFLDYKKFKKDVWYVFYFLFYYIPNIWCKTFGKVYFDVFYSFLIKKNLGMGK